MRRITIWAIVLTGLALAGLAAYSPVAAAAPQAAPAQTPQPTDIGQQLKDQVKGLLDQAEQKVNAEGDKLQNELKQQAQNQADKAALSLKERARLEAHKLIDQSCGGAPAGLVLAGLGLALRNRRLRSHG